MKDSHSLKASELHEAARESLDAALANDVERVLFLGNYEYAPNVDAVEWILSDTWKDADGSNAAGVVAVLDQLVYAARDVQKAEILILRRSYRWRSLHPGQVPCARRSDQQP